MPCVWSFALARDTDPSKPACFPFLNTEECIDTDNFMSFSSFTLEEHYLETVDLKKAKH